MTTPTNICPECGSAPENPAAGDGRVVLVKVDDTAYNWPSRRPAVRQGCDKTWYAWVDKADPVHGTEHPTPALAAAHLGAVLPGEDARPVLSASARDPARWFWPSGRVAVQPGTGGGPYRWLAWPDNVVSTGFTADTPEEAAEKIGARLPKPMCVAETVHSGTGERSVREG